MTIVHIYADAPAYEWTDAAGEGIACVDDAARAAVVYLRYYELMGDKQVEKRIRRLLTFIRMMQAQDGEFYNFVDRDMQINRSGKTSIKSFNFWAARGYWALGYAYKVFRSLDPEYAEELKSSFLRCKIPIKRNLEKFGQTVRYGDRDYPAWLVNGMGSDATSELLLGLCHYLEAESDIELAAFTEKLVEGILVMQLGEKDCCPGMFLSWRGRWHAYANCQTQALARLGQILDRPAWIKAAEYEAERWYKRLIEAGFLRSVELREDAVFAEFPQIAYDVRPVVSGLLRLYEATGKEEYAGNAALAAAWFLGRNKAKRAMYDAGSGRCYDGINGPDDVNLNSGAESTIEALLALMDAAAFPHVKEAMLSWNKKSRRDE
jgi:hypothetical protein